MGGSYSHCGVELGTIFHATVKVGVMKIRGKTIEYVSIRIGIFTLL